MRTAPGPLVLADSTATRLRPIRQRASPSNLHDALFVSYAAWQIYSIIEDGVDGAKVNTNYWQSQYARALKKLQDLPTVKRAEVSAIHQATSEVFLMATAPVFRATSGLNNVIEPHRLKYGEDGGCPLAEESTVIIDDGGGVRRRRARTPHGCTGHSPVVGGSRIASSFPRASCTAG